MYDLQYYACLKSQKHTGIFYIKKHIYHFIAHHGHRLTKKIKNTSSTVDQSGLTLFKF